MDQTNIDIDRVKSYVDGTLAQEERDKIDQLILQDTQFAENFNRQKVMVESMILYHRGKLKEQLAQQDTPDSQPVIPIKRQPRKSWWAMAASLVLIAVAGYYLFYSGPNQSELYAEYYKPYYNVVGENQRSGTATAGAMKAYEKGDYQLALQQINEQLDENPGDVSWRFYRGICHLELDEKTLAIATFLELTKAEDHQFVEPAHWYLGLAYLNDNQLGKAKTVFSTITEKTGPYQKRASEILQAIN